MKPEDIAKIRASYTKGRLSREDLHPDPMVMLMAWFENAIAQEVPEANAVSLATVSAEGQPSVRTVLVKGIEEEGLIFYTNYQSRKGKELNINPKCGLLFFWKELEQQIRIEGKVEQISVAQSKAYFQSRPKGSQIGAWASPQSDTIIDRGTLENRVDELNQIYQDYDALPKPSFWGGYRLIPSYFEFWQGRDNRLHDRFEYQNNNGEWEINRLAP